MEENKLILTLSPQVTPRTEAPVSSVGNSLENALHTSTHSTEGSLPKRPGGKLSRGELRGRREDGVWGGAEGHDVWLAASRWFENANLRCIILSEFRKLYADVS